MKVIKYPNGGKVKTKRYSLMTDPRLEPYRFGDDALLASAYEELVKRKGGGRGDWEDMFGAVAFHEAGPAMNPAQRQVGGGPGRGLYQYEMDRTPETGVIGSGGANTAVKRTMTFLNQIDQEVPSWLNDLSKEDADFSKLTEKQQQLLLIGDHLLGRGDFGDVLQGKDAFVEWWRKHHYGGKDQASVNKMKKDTEKYLKSLQNIPR